jgi:hypothetical protein
MMRAHIRKAPLVCPILPPFFNDRVDQHRNIEADQKSPHDAIPLRASACTLARKLRRYLAANEKAARNMSNGPPGSKLIGVKRTSPGHLRLSRGNAVVATKRILFRQGN